MTSWRPEAVVYDVSALAPGLAAIDGLAHLQLEARRAGVDIALARPSPPLRALLEFAGLTDALRVETIGETEQREERGGVQEQVSPTILPPGLSTTERPGVIAVAVRWACTGRTRATRWRRSAGDTREPRHPIPARATSGRCPRGRCSHSSYGGIDCVASCGSARSAVHVVALECLDVAASNSGWSASLSSRRGSRSLSRAASVARARCSALLTEATLVSSSSATSAPSSAAPRTGSARRAGAVAGAGARRRRPAGSISRRPPRRRGPSRRAMRLSGIGSIQRASGRVCRLASIGALRRPEVHRPGAALPAA